MKKAVLALIAIASIALGVWFGLQSGTHRQTSPTDGIGGDFTLQSDKGPVSLHDFKGRVVALYFGYTRCPDVCPTSLSKLAQAIKQLPEAERSQVQPIFVSIDPERDTPKVASEYARFFFPNGIGLSGSLDQVTRVARQYLVYFQKAEMKGTAMGYSMDHSSIIYVIGRDGKVASLVHHADTVQALGKYLREALTGRSS
jgi:protein SCO1/2